MKKLKNKPLRIKVSFLWKLMSSKSQHADRQTTSSQQTRNIHKMTIYPLKSHLNQTQACRSLCLLVYIRTVCINTDHAVSSDVTSNHSAWSQTAVTEQLQTSSMSDVEFRSGLRYGTGVNTDNILPPGTVSIPAL